MIILVDKIYKKVIIRKCILFILYFFIITTGSGSPYGALIDSDEFCKVWWVGSTYKIMLDDPLPEEKGKVVLRAAKNETESFQLVLHPSTDLKEVKVVVSDFRKTEGASIPAENVIVRNVEYVHVTKPSGKLHQAGWYPDPLPLYEEPFDVVAGRNTPVWITVKVPGNAAPGKYIASINLKTDSWELSIPVELNVWDFSLPEAPLMRSGFNLKSKLIKEYHNLETGKELKQVVDEYFNAFKNYRISPYYFYDLYPIKKNVKGLHWRGGTFDPNTFYGGRYSYQVKDDNTGANTEGRYTDLIEINPKHPYLLKWQAKTRNENQKYTVTVKCYDKNKKPINWSLKWGVYEGSKSWRQDSLYIDPEDFVTYEDLPDYRPFPDNAEYASVQLYAVLPDRKGSQTGTVWFDDFKFIDRKTEANLLPLGDFEQNIDELDLELDFSAFDRAARKYLDTLGFSGFRFKVPEVGKKPFDEIEKTGWFYGFVSGTPEYEKLITLYLKGFQDHLEANRWLGKEYLYWIDEPDQAHYEYVRRGMKTIHKAAPKLTRFLSENHPGPAIMDLTDITCPVLYQVEPERVKEWVEKGKQFWSYLMCWPKEPHVNPFIDSDAINMRMWLWISYRYNLKGIVVWQSNQWFRGGSGAAPDGILQNIWEDPMTYKSGYGTPYGSAPEFGNGDGMFFYPPNRNPNTDTTKYMRGPVPSLRLEILREGLDDYDYMIMLENFVKNATPEQKQQVRKAQKVLDFGSEVFVNDTLYTKNPEVLMKYRKRMGDLLEEFSKF